jgi:hypothetical protein
MNYKNYFKQRLFENILNEADFRYPGILPPQLLNPVQPVVPVQPINPDAPRTPPRPPKPPQPPGENPDTPRPNPDGDQFIPTPRPPTPPTYRPPGGFRGPRRPFPNPF